MTVYEIMLKGCDLVTTQNDLHILSERKLLDNKKKAINILIEIRLDGFGFKLHFLTF